MNAGLARVCRRCGMSSRNPRDHPAGCCLHCHPWAAEWPLVDMHNQPLTTSQWGVLISSLPRRTVARDVVNDRNLLTALTGVNIPYLRVHPFGSGLGKGHGDWQELAQYRTLKQAANGHQALLAWLMDHPNVAFTEHIRQQVIPNSEAAH